MVIHNKTFKQIIDLFTPHFETLDQRRALIGAAFFGTDVANKVQLEGTPNEFTTRTIQTLIQHGEIYDTPALVRLLEQLHTMVGTDQQVKIDTLINQIRYELASNPAKPTGSPRIFISYSRADGEQFAIELRERIEGEGLPLWQDRARMEGGVGWWKQITDALETVEFMVLVATPSAINSPIVKKEWRYARQQGVCVYPVQVPGMALDFTAMPRWMRDSHFYSLEHEWDTFINYLKAPCTVAKVPFMAPDLPKQFVQRSKQFDALKEQLLDANYDNPVAITTALKGAGGFGKTTLAIALCHDEDVQTAFDDGILWATLGENPNILNKLTVLYRALTGESTNFIEIEEGATKLAEKLADLDVLLVIDDVWNPAHLRPFLRGGERVARLVTTRFSNIAVEANAEFLEVDEMTTAESIQMLLAGIEPPGDLTPFQKLAERLGEWALMLEVTNGMIRKRMKVQSASLENALAFVNTALDKRGIGGLKTGSNEAAVQVLDTSIAQVDKSDQLRLFELAVFVEDTDIPLTSVMTLWEMDDFDTQELISQFDDLSFVRFNANRGIIRLHDVVREVLLTQLNNPTAIHAKLVENYGLSSLHSNVSQLPDAYAWRNIAYHLVQSQQKHVLHNLLCEPTYIQNKLNATNDPNTLIDDFEIYALNNDGSDDTLLLVKSALSISSHILSKYPTQCLTQLYGRLQNQMTKSPSISRLLETIQKHEIQPALLTGQPSLQQAGELLRRTLAGHLRSVRSVRFIGDNSEVISASGDKTLRLWNIAQGKFFRIFHGHEYSVSSVSVAPNKKIIASASWDYTVKLWDIETGQEIRTCIGHKDRVNAVLFSPNGQYIISASNDHTIKMWDVSTGQEIRTFLGHRGRVYDIAITADARKLASASSGHTIRLWDVGSGEQLHTLVGHTDRVNAVDFSPDGHSIISASNDGTLKLWNINTGYEIRTYSGHTGRVYDVLFFNSGNFFASASRDRTIRIWDKDMSDAKHIFWGHTGPVNSIAMTSDDMLLVSASNDKTLKVWELENISSQNSSDSISVTTGHSSSVTAVKFNRHGSELISASIDGTLKLWDAITGKEIRTLARHTDRITAIELSPDGSTAISASWDKPPIVWETSSWKQLLMFSGHTGPVNQVAYAPNGETVASASTDTSVEIWDVSSGQRIRTLIDHTGEVNTVTFTPDGNYVISGAGSFGIQKDNTLKLWNIHTGDLVRTFRGHTGDVMSATVSTDGGTILSSSADLTLKLWDLQSGQLIQDLADTPQNRANLYKQHSISLNPILSDLRLIIIPNQDGDLEIWQDDKRLYVFTANGAVQNQACAVSTSLKLVAGDISGKIHFLQPNNALEKIMRGINLAVD